MTDPPDEIKFGTDGWRAVIAREFTFANLERVTQAYADFLKQTSQTLFVVVGFDRRFLSENFAARAVCRVAQPRRYTIPAKADIRPLAPFRSLATGARGLVFILSVL